MKLINLRLVKQKIILINLACTSLTGCIGMGGDFDCNVSSGGRCAPMHHINKMADRGEFQEQNANNASLYIDNKRYSYSPMNLAEMPMRSNDKVQQIWIGPYEDKQGNYHEPAYVYTVVKKGQWESLTTAQAR